MSSKEVRLRQGWTDVGNAISGADVTLGDVTAEDISASSLALSTPLAVADGGTGQITEAEALGEMTQALTEDTTPDRAGDFVNTYDASADTGKKVKLQNVMGGWVQLVAPTAQSTKPLDIVLTAYTAYRAIKVMIVDIDLSADDDLLCRTSTDGGSTFDAAAGNYSWGWVANDTAAAGFFTDASSDTEMDLGYFGGAAAEHGNLEFVIWDQTDATHDKVCSWELIGLEGSVSEPVRISGVGRRAATTDVDALRFQPFTATWSYTYSVYGLI